MRRIAVTGAGGFIGHHLVRHLKRRGGWVRGIDVKLPAFGPSEADEFQLVDLREATGATRALRDVDEVYALAADMGGMGFISKNEATILHDNTLIDLSSIDGACRAGVSRLLYASSACVYPGHLQELPHATPLREADALPAAPQGGYGWAKLYGEQTLRLFAEQHGIECRIARLHNVYGPEGAYAGGREKVPAALCRKVACAPPHGTLEIWSDGEQTRSFCYVEDCVEGICKLMRSDFSEPLNIGSQEPTSINELAALVLGIAQRKDLTVTHVPGPQGVRGRNSDNALVNQVLGWAPDTPLEVGMRVTYEWVERQTRAQAEEIPSSADPVAR
jgi:GDP-D-mannose 3',5'-epimerase